MEFFIVAIISSAVTVSALWSKPNWVAVFVRRFPLGALAVFAVIFAMAVTDNQAHSLAIAGVASAILTMAAAHLWTNYGSAPAKAPSKDVSLRS